MARPKITSGVYYHVYNCGVEKRNTFLDTGDRVRFIHYLYEFNDTDTSTNFSRSALKMKEVGPLSSMTQKDNRKRLVDVVAFVLMPNHYHLILKQRVDQGISLCMQKLGTGYTMFFNAKHERSGVLFQGKFKYKPVTSHEQLQYLVQYVHTNPLPILPKSNEGGPTSFIERLLRYRWSSLPDYAGRKNFPSVTQRDEVLKMFGGEHKYLSDLKPFLKSNDATLANLLEDVSIDGRLT